MLGGSVVMGKITTQIAEDINHLRNQQVPTVTKLELLSEKKTPENSKKKIIL